MELNEYLEAKRNYENDGYNVIWIFDKSFVLKNKELYSKKLTTFEMHLDNIEAHPPKKIGDFLMCSYRNNKLTENDESMKMIHAATSEGFSREQLVYIGKDEFGASLKQKHEIFLNAFKKMLQNKNMIPDRSLIILNNEHKRIIKNSEIPEGKTKERKRLMAANAKGQTTIHNFFSSKKFSQVNPVKKVMRRYKSPLEFITQMLRGDEVKILFLPVSHYELDATEFVSVFLLNEIGRRFDIQDDDDTKDKVIKAVDRLPDQVWTKACDYIKDVEKIYLEEIPGIKIKKEETLDIKKEKTNEKLTC